MSVNLQFVVSDEEYEYLQSVIKEKGISLSRYVRDRVIPEEINQEATFEELWEEFLVKLDKFPSNIQFTVADIMTQEKWNTLRKSSKLSLARVLSKSVANGTLSNVRVIGRSPYNVTLYRKF